MARPVAGKRLLGEKGRGLMEPHNHHKDFKVYSQTRGLHRGAICDKRPLPVEGGHERRNCVGLGSAYRKVLYVTLCLTESSFEG